MTIKHLIKLKHEPKTPPKQFIKTSINGTKSTIIISSAKRWCWQIHNSS